MKTIHACVIGTFLMFHAIAEEESNTGIDTTDILESKNVEDPITRVMKSSDGEVYFPQGKESYYTSYYRAAKLPSMQHKREEKGNLRFRIGILPSFSKPIFLTYSRGAGGASIEITRLQLRLVDHSLEPGDVDLSGKVVVGNRIARNLEAEVMEPRIRTPLSYLTNEQRQMTQGLDGSTWVIEVSTDTDYTMESIWTPEAIIEEPTLLETFKQQKVDVKSMVEDIETLIYFRDLLLEITDMKLPEYRISILLDG